MSGGEVIGFAGTAVEGGIAILEPLLERRDGNCAVGDLEGSGHTPAIFSRAERDELVERGFLTLTSLQWPARDFGTSAGVVLCVHEHFIRSPGHGSPLERAIARLDKNGDSGYYLAYTSKDKAVGWMREWGLWLLEEARSSLKKDLRGDHDADAALEDANRALSLISPIRDEGAVIDAFSMCRASHLLLKADPEIIMLDAEVDFRDQATGVPDQLKLQRIRKLASQYVGGGMKDRITKTARKDLGDPRRRDIFKAWGAASARMGP